jgi:hypothetical protein
MRPVALRLHRATTAAVTAPSSSPPSTALEGAQGGQAGKSVGTGEMAVRRRRQPSQVGVGAPMAMAAGEGEAAAGTLGSRWSSMAATKPYTSIRCNKRST